MHISVRTFLTAASLAALGTAGLVAAPAAAQKKEEAPKPPKLSKEVSKPLAEAQQLQQAGDLAGALAKANEAGAAAKTPDDAYMVNAVKINIGIAKQDNKLLEEAIDGALATGKVPAADLPKFYRNSGALALQRGDTAKAAKSFEQLVALNPNDADATVQLAEIYQRAGNTQQAVGTLAKAIGAKEAAGQVAPETWYRRNLALAYDTKQTAAVTPAALSLVRAYPTPTNWRDALVIFRDGARLDDQGNLDIFRLMAATDSMSGEKDYFEYAETANTRGLPGEAKRTLDAGIAKGALSTSKPYVKELQALVNPKIAKDKASLAGLEKEARADATGKLALGTGDALLGYGDYAKAAEMYKLALQKGGVDAATANTRLGYALGMSGDKAGAEAALRLVKGGKREELASYYLAWLSRKG